MLFPLFIYASQQPQGASAKSAYLPLAPPEKVRNTHLYSYGTTKSYDVEVPVIIALKSAHEVGAREVGVNLPTVRARPKWCAARCLRLHTKHHLGNLPRREARTSNLSQPVVTAVALKLDTTESINAGLPPRAVVPADTHDVRR